jgi:hypothetical protein
MDSVLDVRKGLIALVIAVYSAVAEHSATEGMITCTSPVAATDPVTKPEATPWR